MPQTKNNTVQVLSFGCASNFGEGEMIAGLLQESGLHLTSTAQEAQAVVLNVCTVKGIRSALKEIRMAIAQAPNVPIVITGCTTPELAQQAHALSPSIHISNTHKLKSIPELVSRVLHNQSTSQDDFETTTDSKINLPRQRYNPVVGIVPVCSGCLDYCTFCSTRLVKGQLYSFAPSEIIADIKMHLQQGCQEIWITGQDAACYGADIGTNLPTLIHQILNEIPGNYKIRIGMGNPRHLIEYLPELVSIFEDPRVYKFLHLSVQSGSDAVLEKMARRHKVQEYLDIVHALRSYYPEFTISTDIIVGFPGETEQDFLQTLDLLQQTRPSVCNRTRFVSRKGTVAAKLEQSDLRISKLEKKRRSAELTRVFKNIALENNTQWVGWKGPILIEEPGKTALVNQQESIINWQGRNYAYKQVVVQGDFIPGDTVEVEIIRADIFYLEGRVISPQ